MSHCVFLLSLIISVIRVQATLNIFAPDKVESVLAERALLPCKIETDKSVRQVVWFRLTENSSKKIVYYFEPPEFNDSSSEYKNRLKLAKDLSSLVFLSVAKSDEGFYECRVTVASNGTYDPGEIPEELNRKIELVVNVPPGGIRINHLTSKQNMTLTCRSAGSKPPAKISWAVQRNDEVKTFKSAKIITEYHNNLADTVGYFYMTLSQSDEGIIVYCVVKHPETGTVLRKNVTMVAPELLHAVPMEFDWLGGSVLYSTYDLNSSDDDLSPKEPKGLIKLRVSPSPSVPVNSSVRLSVTSNGAFPEPTYTWWSEDTNLGSGRLIRIKHMLRSQQVFCLIENPVGRALMSVQLTTTGADPINPVSEALPQNNEAVVSGALVGAIAFGSLVFILVVAFLIYYCVYKPSNKKSLKIDEKEGNDFDSYMIKKKPPNFSHPATHTEVSDARHAPASTTPIEKQSLLENSPDITQDFIESYSEKHKQENFANRSTSTSGYGGDLNGSNGVEGGPNGRRSSSKRAISQHLQDFDENASFVGGYGSTFGIDEISAGGAATRTRNSVSDSDTDKDNYQGHPNGFEPHYSLPPQSGSSSEIINPNLVVKPHERPTDI